MMGNHHLGKHDVEYSAPEFTDEAHDVNKSAAMTKIIFFINPIIGSVSDPCTFRIQGW